MLLFSSAMLLRASDIPAGSHVKIRINNGLSSASAHSGQAWDGSLTSDIVDANGKTVIHAGVPVTGKVSYAKSSGRLHAPGQLSLRLTSINGETVYSSRYSVKGKGHMKSNTTKIGGGAAVGAVIGALAGGGKGAAIGAGAGAAAGTGVAAVTGKEEVVIPSESVISFTITGSSGSAPK